MAGHSSCCCSPGDAAPRDSGRVGDNPVVDLKASRLLRTSRAALLGAVIMTVGSVAHVSADGRLPGLVGMLVLYAVASGACAAFLGREASALRLVALTVGGQTLLHTALAAVAGHNGDRFARAAVPAVPAVPVTPAVPAGQGGPVPGASGLSLYDQLSAGAPRPVQAPTTLAVPDWLVHGVADVASQPVMALAHLGAAALIALWLALGERTLWSLVRLARAGVEGLVARLAAVARAQVARLHGVVRTVLVRVDWFLARPVLPVWSRGPVRRGPPATLLAR